jgi:hypothetical protein
MSFGWTAQILLAARSRPSSASPQRPEKIRPRHEREAKRRKAHANHFLRSTTKHCRSLMPGAAARFIGACPPSGASPRLSPGLSHPGSAPGHASWHAVPNGRYPLFPRPSAVAAPHASAVVPKGMMPEAAPARVQIRAEAPHSLTSSESALAKGAPR